MLSMHLKNVLSGNKCTEGLLSSSSAYGPCTGRDSFSRLLSHVAKHMLVLQGEGPAQPTCLGTPPPPLRKAVCCPPRHAQCGGSSAMTAG